MNKAINCAPVGGTRPSARYKKKIMSSDWRGNDQAAIHAGHKTPRIQHTTRLMDHLT